MAYSANNSANVVSVTNFGALGDGVRNNRAAIQSAIDSFQSKGLAGTVYIPRGDYICSGQLVISGHNITLQGEPGAVLRAFDENDFRKIAVTGAGTGLLVSGVSVLGLAINGGRTSSTTEVYDGVINLHNTKNFTVQDCSIGNFLGIGVFPQFNNENVDVLNNRFYEYHLGIFNDGRSTGCGLKYLTVDNNIFDRSWYQPEKNYFAAVKIQAPEIIHPCFGHKIVNNKIYLPSLLGIEFWGYVQNSIVANNYIESGVFGISIANNSNNIVVDGNVTKDTTLYGIEVAESDNITVSNNSVCGNGRVRDAIIINSSDNANVVGNSVNGFTHAGITTYNSSTLIQNTNIVGNTIVQSGMYSIPFYYQGGNFVNFSENTVKCDGSGTYFVMIDYDTSITYNGLTIARNDFVGSVTDWGILFYGGANTGSIENCLIEENRTYGVESCGYGMLNYTSYPPTSFLARNNYGQTGSLGYYISDAELPVGTTPYSAEALYNGYQFYTVATLSLTGVINSTSGAWMKIYSRDEGNIQSPRFAIDFSENVVPYSFDGKKDVLEFVATKTPYGGQGNIYVTPQAPYVGGNFVEKIAVDNPAAGSVVDVWVQFPSGSSGISGLQIYVYGDESVITGPVLQFQRPDFHSSAVILGLDQSNRNNLKVTRGVSIGTGADEIYSPTSGYLSTSAIYSAKNYRMDLSGLPPAISSAGASGRLTFDFNNPGLQTVLITGGTVISGTNYYPGAALTVRMFATTPSQPLAWAPWTFVGTTTPTGLATSKTAILSLQCFDTTDTGVVAAYAVQP
jgi:parallel beta-helix repeat protein